MYICIYSILACLICVSDVQILFISCGDLCMSCVQIFVFLMCRLVCVFYVQIHVCDMCIFMPSVSYVQFAAMNLVSSLRVCLASLGREGPNKVPMVQPNKGSREELNMGPRQGPSRVLRDRPNKGPGGKRQAWRPPINSIPDPIIYYILFSE